MPLPIVGVVGWKIHKNKLKSVYQMVEESEGKG